VPAPGLPPPGVVLLLFWCGGTTPTSTSGRASPRDPIPRVLLRLLRTQPRKATRATFSTCPHPQQITPLQTVGSVGRCQLSVGCTEDCTLPCHSGQPEDRSPVDRSAAGPGSLVRSELDSTLQIT